MEIWEMILRFMVILMCYGDYIYGNSGIYMGHLEEHNGTINAKVLLYNQMTFVICLYYHRYNHHRTLNHH